MVSSRSLLGAGLAVLAALSASGAARAGGVEVLPNPTYSYTLNDGSYDFIRPAKTVDRGISGTITVANHLVTGLDLSVDLPSGRVLTFLTSGILDQEPVTGDWLVGVNDDSSAHSHFILNLDLQPASTLFGGGGATLGPDTRLILVSGDIVGPIGNNFTGAFTAPGPVPGAGLAGFVALALAGLYVRARRD